MTVQDGMFIVVVDVQIRERRVKKSIGMSRLRSGRFSRFIFVNVVSSRSDIDTGGKMLT